MKSSKQPLTELNASRWAKCFMEFFPGSRSSGTKHYVSPETLASFAAKSPERVILFLDYDGTLFPIVQVPQMAKPDAPLLKLLEKIADVPAFEIHIISGRPKATMEAWFPFPNIHLHAEHGAISRPAKSNEWEPILHSSESSEWKAVARKLMSEYMRTTEGSFIEQKEHSLVWHYRMADSVLADEKAKALILQARSVVRSLGLEVLAGKKSVEIRRIGVNKGCVIKKILLQRDESVLPIAIGDDVTDEDMFKALGNQGMTIAVGDQKTHARYRLRDPSDVRLFLERIASKRTLLTPAAPNK